MEKKFQDSKAFPVVEVCRTSLKGDTEAQILRRAGSGLQKNYTHGLYVVFYTQYCITARDDAEMDHGSTHDKQLS